jgi:putative transcriptional regulator
MSEAVHNRIAMLRAERQISRRELADALGVHYQTVGYLERGEFSPSLYLALRIAAYFEVPVEVVFSTRPFARIGSVTDERAAPATEARSVAEPGHARRRIVPAPLRPRPRPSL